MKTYFRFLVIFIIFFGVWKLSFLQSETEALSREILAFGDTNKLTKKCLIEIQNLIRKSRNVQRLSRCQSFRTPTGDFERALDYSSNDPKSDCVYTQKTVNTLPTSHWTYLKSRKSDPALKWLQDRLRKISPNFKPLHSIGSVKNGIIYLGLLDPAIQNGIREGIGHGGPLGELIQWADLIAALDSIDLIGFRIVISIDELGLVKSKTCYEETEFPNIDFLITDITGAKEGFQSN